ncbi:bifunctional hydroxymethylpyrimidine kinase/phosphomethylpyrimidine kinase [Velocimicrobium porci]|uniref:Hydroxymethylpyrimidine/phosphomethylpyrimidine kinase n=1 Tax=Velocimicrobium porci TaxID=2606634 RepID=A0A6L5Y242_9FIRM|nr:bifunctional hydroxymethylpyrimidine kinase/phosphomethylpyrimidine kinase [Velocimicrobium porci]MSS64428.1 bifunctional hydroxymethylpyrimidine kinase/phosphomethylpyrimidine kinase [Velocimicrobium porci]
MLKVLTIAGSDCSGGAGIQADIKTITVHKQYAMSVITAVTAQNTTGVYGIMDVEPEFVAKQIDCVFCDIKPDAVKIGMVSNKDIIEVIADKLEYYKAKHIVVDPVMVSTSGNRLLCKEAEETLKTRLLPIAELITPNIPEASVLSEIEISKREEMEEAGSRLKKWVTGSVLIKGGHSKEQADDLLCWNNNINWICGERVANPNTHGTGCTLSSAIACNLAEGNNIYESVKKAKEYVTGALNAKLKLGVGSGPLNHSYLI